MKVYVDKLPKSCAFCPCYDCESCCCDISDVDLYICENFNRYKQIHKDCPLHTISDHDKQVRKQVCDGLAISLIKFFSKEAEFTVEEICNWLQEVKNQIEKGE